MMEYVLAFLLGLVQGVAEFLPISSSGHLVLAERWLSGAFGDHSRTLQGSAFNIAVHVGTLGSIVIVYFRRLLEAATDVRLIALVVLATLPVVATGLAFKDAVESLMQTPQKVGFALLGTAVLLALIGPVERWHATRRAKRRAADPPTPQLAIVSDETDDERPADASTIAEEPIREASGRTLATMRWTDALIVGLFQSVAIVPGVSRSGSTIFGGVLAGMDRRDAADFSFFIAIPAIAGAAVLKLKEVVTSGQIEVAPDVLVWGATVALVTGLVSLKLLLRLIAKGRLVWFSVYCSLVGFAAIVAFGG